MGAFILRRLIEAVPVLFLATIIIFLGLRMLPGDPVVVLAGQDASPQTLAAIREANGLNEPLPVQYVIWLKKRRHGAILACRSSLARRFRRLIVQRAPATGWSWARRAWR